MKKIEIPISEVIGLIIFLKELTPPETQANKEKLSTWINDLAKLILDSIKVIELKYVVSEMFGVSNIDDVILKHHSESRVLLEVFGSVLFGRDI